MPTLHRDGCRIYWRADGDASLPALVLANSLGTDVTLWDPILDTLMQDYFVIRYDMRGHGGSDTTPGDYSLDQLTDDAQAVIAASGAPSFNFWGISLGGMVGMALGARKAVGLRKLVLSNTAAQFDKAVWVQRIEAIRQGGMAAVADAVIGRFYTPAFVQADSIGVRRMRHGVLSQSPEGYIGCCAAIRDMTLLPKLAAISAPALIVTGSQDQSTQPARGEELRANIAGSSIVSVPSAHIPVTEIPERYLAAVLPFLKS